MLVHLRILLSWSWSMKNNCVSTSSYTEFIPLLAPTNRIEIRMTKTELGMVSFMYLFLFIPTHVLHASQLLWLPQIVYALYFTILPTHLISFRIQDAVNLLVWCRKLVRTNQYFSRRGYTTLYRARCSNSCSSFSFAIYSALGAFQRQFSVVPSSPACSLPPTSNRLFLRATFLLTVTTTELEENRCKWTRSSTPWICLILSVYIHPL